MGSLKWKWSDRDIGTIDNHKSLINITLFVGRDMNKKES
jgi:hypothetical protein